MKRGPMVQEKNRKKREKKIEKNEREIFLQQNFRTPNRYAGHCESRNKRTDREKMLIAKALEYEYNNKRRGGGSPPPCGFPLKPP